ncbi:hypothetical protein niasHT_038674 [Heterodera trifolii]|uniref:Endoplasmic reticulum junction formation protein lunapark n=1 Tax=Heterodera trifolii TaxID=157864 RepID=A0ABD2I2Q5_9BILA
MGNILWSRKRPPSEELDELVLQIRELEAQLKQLLADRAGILRWLNWFTVLVVTVLSSLGWFQHGPVRHRLLSVAMVWLCAGLLLWLVRHMVFSAFGWLVGRKRSRITLFTELKLSIIERVKENEKYNVAMELIKKYGDDETEKNKNGGVAGTSFGHGNKNGSAAIRRRSSKDINDVAAEQQQLLGAITATNAGTALSTPAPGAGKVLPKLYEMQDNASGIIAGAAALRNRTPAAASSSLALGGGTPTPYHHHYYHAQQRTPIRPFIEQSRTPVDRVLDFLMGESINSRYALICAHCHTHNGMALLEEFKSLSFFCYKCNGFNASKNELTMQKKSAAAATAAEMEVEEEEDEEEENNNDDDNVEEEEEGKEKGKNE